MQLDTLEEYLLLADLLNLSETADRLHISKSALSKHISSLEREIGTSLFYRGPEFDLTPAGIVFLNTATRMVEYYKHTIRECRQVGEKYPRLLSISTVSLLRDAALEKIKKALDGLPNDCFQQFTNIQVLPSQEMLFTLLLNGTHDFSIYYDTEPFEQIQKQHSSEGLSCIQISEDPIVALLNEDSPLMKKETLQIADLQNMQVVIIMGRRNPIRRLVVTQLFEKSGFVPSIKLIYDDALDDSVILPDSTDSVRLVAKSILNYPPYKGLPYREFNPPCTQNAYGFYKESNDYFLFTAFLESLKRVTENK